MLDDNATADAFMGIFGYKRADEGECMEDPGYCSDNWSGDCEVGDCKNCDQKYTCQDGIYAKSDTTELKHCKKEEVIGACLNCNIECRECDQRDTCEGSEWPDSEYSFVEKMSKSDVVELLEERDQIAADFEIVSSDYEDLAEDCLTYQYAWSDATEHISDQNEIILSLRSIIEDQDSQLAKCRDEEKQLKECRDYIASLHDEIDGITDTLELTRDDNDEFSNQLDEALDIIDKQFDINDEICAWVLENSYLSPAWVRNLTDHCLVIANFKKQFEDDFYDDKVMGADDDEEFDVD